MAHSARAGRRRIAGIVAGLAVLGAAALSPVGSAQAAPPASGAPSASSDVRTPAKTKPNLRKGKLQLPTPGAKGPRFQARTTENGASPRVVNGTLANASEFPYIVGIVTSYQDGSDFYYYWCTGTIIAPNKVLTAAHCTADGPGTTRVIAGNNQLLDSSGTIVGGSGYVAEVASTWAHQSWNIAAQYDGTATTILDDVAVLTLKQNLPTAYTPVTLSGQGDQTPYAAGTSAQIVGYGVTSSSDPGDTRLRKATVAMQSDATCAAPGGYDRNRMICAGDVANGVDTCGGDSGGPLLVAGKQVGITDWGFEPCGSKPGYYERLSYYADSIRQDLTRPALVNSDWTGDGHTDLIGRDSAGKLYLHTGSGFGNDGYGGFWSRRQIGTGFGSATYKQVFRVYNWNGDRKPSVMMVKTNGELFIYDSDGAGNFVGSARRIGTGWGGFTALMVTNNWLGNNRPSLLARKSNGELIRYTSNGTGGWDNPAGTRIGTGWNMFNLFLTPGAWKGDGLEVIIGRKPTGELVLYQSDGSGGWTNPAGTQIGSGWANYRDILTPGDWNGDNMMDLLGVNSSGNVRLYTTNGYGQWLDASGKQINTGFQAYSPVF
ncbi:trypsin-like serine protease [Micromonospora sp. WMMA1923]|uniref:trypsin-like serine protease n=1 Tax=Micromonospora sp. WMMA1923 TaxID=3404125 RepID=UPI003B94CD9A